MDIVFNCPECRQELEVDESGAGSDIECPACGATITIPEPSPVNIRAIPATGPANPGAAQAREKHLTVPVGKKAPVQIERPKATLETQAKGLDKKLKVKTFRRSDYTTEPNNAFDKAVSDFLASLDDHAIHSLVPVHHSHVDAATGQVLNDYGVMVIYRS
jgi:DNA-directed RNA polymerase subunit RPC12/RpoP